MLMWLNEESWQHYQISELKWLDYTLLEAIIYILIKDYHYSTLMAQKQSNNSEIPNLRAKNISSSYINLTNARLKNKHMKKNLKKKLFLLWMGKKRTTQGFIKTAVNLGHTFRIANNKILSLHLPAPHFYHVSKTLQFWLNFCKNLALGFINAWSVTVFHKKGIESRKLHG